MTRDTDIERFVKNNLQDCVIFVVVLTDAIEIYQVRAMCLVFLYKYTTVYKFGTARIFLSG